MTRARWFVAVTMAVVVSPTLFPLPLTGQDPRSDSTAPEGRVPVAEMLDAVDASGPEPGGDDARTGEVRVPVLLVPGWSDGPEEMEPLEVRFLESGWPLGRVLAVEFEDPVGSNRVHAETVSAAVRSLRAATGAPRVDIVAHSMGGLAVRRYLQDAGAAGNGAAGSAGDSLAMARGDSASAALPVRRVVFLGTPHRGTAAAWLAWGEGGDEMEPGSPFLDSLNAGPPVPDRVEALSVRTPLDLRVIPGESASLPDAENTRNVEVCCPTHPGLLDHEETFRVLVDFLRERDEGDRGEAGSRSTPGTPG